MDGDEGAESGGHQGGGDERPGAGAEVHGQTRRRRRARTSSTTPITIMTAARMFQVQSYGARWTSYRIWCSLMILCWIVPSYSWKPPAPTRRPPHQCGALNAVRRRSSAKRNRAATTANQPKAWKTPSETRPAAGVDLS